MKTLTRMPVLCLCALVTLALTTPAFAASDNCPAVNAIGNFQQSALVQTFWETNSTNGTVTYHFTGSDPSNPSVDGVPGLITYCVYPDGSNLPDAGVNALAVGADGEAWNGKLSAKGSFSFTRPDGNPSNVPFDGADDIMGNAIWSSSCITDPDTGVTVCSVPATFTIVLHINDASECASLYGGTSDTCWVIPNGGETPPPPACNGDPACKSAQIDEATGDFTTCIVNGVNYGTCPIVPLNTLLHIHYVYVIANQPANSFNMIFNPYNSRTQDINSGGGKDYFGCEQIPDPNGNPKNFGLYYPYETTGMQLNFVSGNGSCNQSRFFLRVPTGQPSITLTPGQSITFTVDMITRSNRGAHQEYTSCGPHLLNSGFTVKWFQSNDTLLHSFTTGITPLYVYAQCP